MLDPDPHEINADLQTPTAVWDTMAKDSLLLLTTVRGCLGAHQHRLRDEPADAPRHRGGRRPHLCEPTALRAGGRPGAGHLGPRQHCRRLPRVQELRP
jgi:hypothetical protein